MIVIAKFKTGHGIIIASNVFIIIEKPVFECKSITTAENIWIIVSEKVNLIFPPIEIDTVLRFWNNIQFVFGFIKTSGSPYHHTSVKSVIFSFFRFYIDDP